MAKRWQPIDWAECPSCGDSVEALTDAEPGWVYDSDDARCVTCDWEGVACADEGGCWLSEGNMGELDDDGK